MKDPRGEHPLSLSEAAKLVPGRPHVASLWRWCRRGVRARDGRRIHLEHRRFGQRIFVTAEALDRFGAALAAADREHFAEAAEAGAVVAPPRHRTDRQRERDIAAAEAELDAAGI